MDFTKLTANPFIPGGGAKEWHSNELILTDPIMREKAGVSVLDREVSALYKYNPKAKL